MLYAHCGAKMNNSQLESLHVASSDIPILNEDDVVSNTLASIFHEPYPHTNTLYPLGIKDVSNEIL